MRLLSPDARAGGGQYGNGGAEHHIYEGVYMHFRRPRMGRLVGLGVMAAAAIAISGCATSVNGTALVRSADGPGLGSLNIEYNMLNQSTGAGYIRGSYSDPNGGSRGPLTITFTSAPADLCDISPGTIGEGPLHGLQGGVGCNQAIINACQTAINPQQCLSSTSVIASNECMDTEFTYASGGDFMSWLLGGGGHGSGFMFLCVNRPLDSPNRGSIVIPGAYMVIVLTSGPDAGYENETYLESPNISVSGGPS